jgi:L-xylulokinase
MSKYLLGIDNGSTVVKAAIFSTNGEEIAVASRKTRLLTPVHGHSERDMNEIWTATAEAIREVIETSGVDAKEIACVGCTGHGNGLYLIDKNGDPVRNAIMSTDNRAQSYSDKWNADGLDKKTRPMTMQSIWAAQPNTLLAWLKDNEPESIKNTQWILMCKDYIRYRLSGKVHAEITDFSGTSLLNLQSKDYDLELLKLFGLEDLIEKLPPIVLTQDITGYVSEEAAFQTGLVEGTPIAAGMFDIDACGLASGMINDTQLCMIAGTWGNNQYISKIPVVDENVFMTSCYSIPDYYLMLEGSATSASNLEWFLNEFFSEELYGFKKENRSVYDYCNDLVRSTHPEETNVVFLPFLYGSNSHPDAKACFLGVDGWHNKGHLLRAIYEGIVFGHKTHVDKLLKFREMPETIQLTGGAANSKEWVQIFADIFQVPIELPTGTELGALGAAIAAAVATEIYPNYDSAVKKMVKFSKVIEPDKEKADLYEIKYFRYKKAAESLIDLWHDFN